MRKPREVQEGIGFSPRRRLVFRRHRRDIADDVGEFLRVRIITRIADIGLHARQIGQVQIDPREILPRQILRHQQGREGLTGCGILEDLGTRPFADGQDFGKRIERRLHAVMRQFGHDQHTIIAPVRRERLSKTVQHASAWRYQQPFADAVLLRLGKVLVAFDDLKLIEPSLPER